MRSSRRCRALTMDQLVDRVRREFAALPGLRLTESQVGRLWSLDGAMSHRVLRCLVEGDYLKQTVNGLYERADSACQRPVVLG